MGENVEDEIYFSCLIVSLIIGIITGSVIEHIFHLNIFYLKINSFAILILYIVLCIVFVGILFYLTSAITKKFKKIEKELRALLQVLGISIIFIIIPGYLFQWIKDPISKVFGVLALLVYSEILLYPILVVVEKFEEKLKEIKINTGINMIGYVVCVLAYSIIWVMSYTDSYIGIFQILLGILIFLNVLILIIKNNEEESLVKLLVPLFFSIAIPPIIVFPPNHYPYSLGEEIPAIIENTIVRVMYIVLPAGFAFGGSIVEYLKYAFVPFIVLIGDETFIFANVPKVITITNTLNIIVSILILAHIVFLSVLIYRNRESYKNKKEYLIKKMEKLCKY